MSLNEIEVEVKKLIDTGALNGKTIYTFGANRSSINMIRFLRQNNIFPKGIIDNNEKKHGQIIEGLEVTAPKNTVCPYDEDKVILIASEYHKEMCSQLEGFGYKKDEQVFVTSVIRKFYDLSDKTYGEYINKLKKGFEIYSKLTLDEKTMVFICPYPGTGDIFLIGLYLQKYIEDNDISDYIIVVKNNTCKRVFDIFEYQNIVIIEDEEVESLVCFSRIMKDTVKCRILNESYMRIMHRRLRGYKGLDFNTMLRIAVFEQADEYVPEFPKDKISNEEVNEFFKKNNLIPEKTIILSPYAKSVDNVPDFMWESIADNLIEKGYLVCTNSANDKEPAIKGTTALFIPFKILRPVLKRVYGLIALRSGLCDIVGDIKSKKVIFYPKGTVFGSSTPFLYFSLNLMQLCDDAVEIEYDDQQREKMLEMVCKVF